jgi:hypothetical protein
MTKDIDFDARSFLNDLFCFIGAKPVEDFSDYHLNDHVLKGIDVGIPDEYRVYFETVFSEATDRLGKVLERNFGLNVPESWLYRSTANAVKGQCFPDMSDVLPNRDVDWHSLPRFIESFEEYNILFYEGRFHALSQRSGDVNLHRLGTEMKK